MMISDLEPTEFPSEERRKEHEASKRPLSPAVRLQVDQLFKMVEMFDDAASTLESQASRLRGIALAILSEAYELIPRRYDPFLEELRYSISQTYMKQIESDLFNNKTFLEGLQWKYGEVKGEPKP